MRRIILLVLFLLLTSIASAGEEVLLEDLKIRVTLDRISPSPAQKGNDLDVWFRVKNYGGDLSGVKMRVPDQFPFSYRSGEDGLREYNVFKSGNELLLKFNMKVSDEAKEAVKKINLQISARGIDRVYIANFAVDIRDINEEVLVDSVETIPNRISPGQGGKLKIVIANQGTSAMDDLIVRIDFSGVPLVPLHSTNERRFNRLEKGENVEMLFDIVALADAESRAYSLPVDITYYDKVGNKLSRNTTTGVVIYSEPEYKMALEDVKVFQKRQNGDIVVSLFNTGPSEMKFITLELEKTKDYEVIGSNRIYLGNLESDDFETAKFTIYVNKVKGDIVPLKLKLDYKDAFNTPIEEIQTVDLRLYNSGEARKFGLAEPSSAGNFLVYIIILIFVYYVYREWRKEKDLPRSIKIVLKKTVIKIFRILLFPFRRRKNKRK